MRRPAPLVVVLLACLLVALPATAQAAETFKGRTSQGRTVVVRTADSGLVTLVRLRWTAACESAETDLTSRLSMYPRFFNRVSTARRIRGVGRYKAKAAPGTFARIRATVTGRRSKGRWRGTFTATATVRRDGETIDRCRTPRIRWSAKRVEAR